jgi:hydroxymethylbilane synthase
MVPMAPLKLGTRGSKLALVQARLVADALDDAEIVPIETSKGSGERGGDKARFVRGIEEALLVGEVELGVHSAKDLPSELPDGLELVGVSAREDAADAYVGAAGALADVPDGARIGTSSLRRRAQLLAQRPDVEIVDLRGNVDTRLGRLADGDFDGIVLAAAGLRRLDREGEIAFRFGADEMTPAAGQGALALEARSDDSEAAAAAASITDRAALTELTAERAAIAELDASCNTPVGIRASLDADALRVDGFAGLPDGSEWVRDAVSGAPEQPGALGQTLAERMLAAGARDVLERAESFA